MELIHNTVVALTLKDAKTTGAFTSNESKSTVPQEPKKVPKASELYFRNPKTDPRLIQMEKKKVRMMFLNTDFNYHIKNCLMFYYNCIVSFFISIPRTVY